MKKILYIFMIAILAFSCDDDEDNFDLVQLKDTSVNFSKDTIRVNIIGDSQKQVVQFVDVFVDLNIIKATSIKIITDKANSNISNSEGKLIYSFPESVDYIKGDLTRKIQFVLNTKFIPIDEEVRIIKFDLETADCILGDMKSVVFKIQRIMKPLEPQVVFSSSFDLWSSDDGDYVNGEVTLPDGGTWLDMEIPYSPSVDGYKTWGGVWLRDGKVCYEPRGLPLAVTSINGVDYVSMLEKDALISAEDIDNWYSVPGYDKNVDYAGVPHFGSEWYGKTTYFAFQGNINDVVVNGWMLVSVNADGTNLSLLEYAYESQGLPIKAGQKF